MRKQSRSQVRVTGATVKVGDRLNASGRSRVAKIHTVNGKVYVKVTTPGSRLATVVHFAPEQALTVWRSA